MLLWVLMGFFLWVFAGSGGCGVAGMLWVVECLEVHVLDVRLVLMEDGVVFVGGCLESLC